MGTENCILGELVVYYAYQFNRLTARGALEAERRFDANPRNLISVTRA